MVMMRLVAAGCSAAGISVLALTAADLQSRLDGFGGRRDAVLERQVTSPYPPAPAGADPQLRCWNRLDFALAALYLSRDVEAAQDAVREVADLGIDRRIGNGEKRFHWIAPLLIRIHELFHAGSSHFPGRLTPDSASRIATVLRGYLASEAPRMRYSSTDVWQVWGSENHDAQHLQTLWGAALILSRLPAHAEADLGQGCTPRSLYGVLNAFVKQQMRERVRRGLLVECGSPGYGKYTLSCWYNHFDFGDAELRRLTEAAITLWWADWAQEQIGTVSGSAKTRVYQGDGAERASADATAAMAWFYLDVGTPRNAHPALMNLATSAYRLPLTVMKLALDSHGRGIYESVSRRPGLMRDRHPAAYPRSRDPDGMMVLDAEYGGLLRYAFCTPDFVMGSWLLEKRSFHDWSAISMQNRWQGVIFAGSDPDARLFPQCEGLGNRKTYNQFWGVQRQGTMIVCRLPGPDFSRQAGDLRVYFAPSLKRSEAGPWICAEAERAFAAVLAVAPEQPCVWDDPNWLRCPGEAVPVIIEVARRQDYPHFAAFCAAVQASRPEVAEGVLTYRGLGDAGTFRFAYADTRLPEIDGVPIDLAPPFAYRSPFINSGWPGDVVTIRTDAGSVVLDVRDPGER